MSRWWSCAICFSFFHLNRPDIIINQQITMQLRDTHKRLGFGIGLGIGMLYYYNNETLPGTCRKRERSIAIQKGKIKWGVFVGTKY